MEMARTMGPICCPRSKAGSQARRAFLEIGFVPSDIRFAIESDPALGMRRWAWFEALSYGGVQALIRHRLAHFVWNTGLRYPARLMQARTRFLTGVDIHPAARIGAGVFIDHGMGTVIGETAEVGSGVVLFHQVTLGGRGSATGKRHPTVEKGALIGVGAKILGPVRIGERAKIGANAVVLMDVPAGATAVGVPARLADRHY